MGWLLPKLSLRLRIRANPSLVKTRVPAFQQIGAEEYQDLKVKNRLAYNSLRVYFLPFFLPPAAALAAPASAAAATFFAFGAGFLMSSGANL